LVAISVAYAAIQVLSMIVGVYVLFRRILRMVGLVGHEGFGAGIVAAFGAAGAGLLIQSKIHGMDTFLGPRGDGDGLRRPWPCCCWRHRRRDFRAASAT